MTQAPSCPCGIMLSRNLGVPEDKEGCILPEGHQGSHLSRTNQGLIGWETDWECDCEHCLRCEGDYCEVYWKHSVKTEPALSADSPPTDHSTQR